MLIPLFMCLTTLLYTNNLKNGECNKEAPQNSYPMQEVAFVDPLRELDKNIKEKLTLPKTDSADYLCPASDLANQSTEIHSDLLITTPIESTSVLISQIIVTDHESLVHPSIAPIVIEGLDLPGTKMNLEQSLHFHLNQPISAELISNIKQTLINYYTQHNRPVILAYAPEQDLSNGSIHFIIEEGRVGTIDITGNLWFSSSLLRHYLRIKPGDRMNLNQIHSDLFWMNRNPFRRSDLIFSPGKEERTTDLQLVTSDRFPLRTYTGVDNTGTNLTGNNRLFTGFNWGNAFNTDQHLSYQYTTSSDFSRFQAHTLQYDIPLPWRHMLKFFGGYSSVSGIVSSSQIGDLKMRSSGFSAQTSIRYTIPIPAKHSFLHEYTAGFDFKRTNNNLDFVEGDPIIGKLANLTQFMSSYNLGYKIKPLTLSFEIEGFYSPTELVGDESSSNYQSIRPFATADYFYFRSSLGCTWRFWKNFAIFNALRGQYANRNLLPSEEFGVGGYNTVRGYRERAINGDNAFVWNFEIQTPPFPLIDFFMKGKENVSQGTGKSFPDSLQLLLFFDLGWTGVHQASEFEANSQHAISFGPGLRYNITPYLNLRVDYGKQLYSIPFQSGPYHRLHFSLTAGY